MATYRVTGPDGTVYRVNGPDGASNEQVMDALGEHLASSIDYARPVDQVRADVAKLGEPFRKKALDKWASGVVAKEREEGGVGQRIDNAVRTVSRGTFAGPWLDEITGLSSSALHKVTGGAAGAPYDETVAYQRAKDKAFDDANPVTSFAGKLVGGVAGGGAALKAKGAVEKGLGVVTGGPLAFWQPADKLAGRMVQGAVTGTAYGAVAGAGSADGGDMADAAEKGAIVGGLFGMALPPVIQGAGAAASRVADAVSPQVARAQADMNRLALALGLKKPEAAPRSLSAAATPSAGAAAAPVSGADAAAEQIIANQLVRANVTVPQLRERVAQAAEAARFNSNSRAENALAPVDLDQSLQRLASTVARQQPEAANIAQTFISARQTGQTPASGVPAGMALPTRQALSQPQTGDRPMGQFERVKDALKRSLLIKDSDSHGHAANAYQTEKQIIQTARDEAKPLYAAAYEAGQNVNIRPVIEPVVQKWAVRMEEEPAPVAQAIRRALALFQNKTGPVTSIERFDKSKQYMDGVIEKYFESSESRNRYLGGLMTELKNDLLKAVDDVPAIGPAYQQARGAYSSQMELRDALNLGRSVFREGSDVVADQFAALRSPAEQKLFRLGLLDSFEQQMGRSKRTADVTQLFESPRVQEILRVVIPRTEKDGAVFANRPERFGAYIAGEKNMIGTRNEVLGNSKTAQRIGDDKAFADLETIGNAMQRIREAPTMGAAVFRGVQAILDKTFGMRADTAAAVARKLFTADQQQRQQLLFALADRMGPSRTAQLARYMDEYQRQLTQATATAVPQAQQSSQ